MAITPPGDIVLDVARAVEPSDFQAAHARLAQRGGGAPEVAFDAAFTDHTSSLRDKEQPIRAKSRPDSFVRFEAMVLQTFIQSMLPKDAENVYGKGVAGEMWQSLLSEKLGESLAARGGIGIAERMLPDHYYEGERKNPLGGVPSGEARAELAERQLLADTLVKQLQSTLTGSVHQDSSEATNDS